MKNNLKELLEIAFENYKRLVLKEGPIDQLDQCTATDVMGYGTTIDEIIHDITEMKELARLQRQQTEGPNFHYTSTPVFRKIMEHGKSAICVDVIQLNFLFDNEPLIFDIRLSVMMEMIDGRWKAAHFHASKPEYDSGGNDPWHKEEWKQKMQELQQKVNEQTAELLNQNRELEIEAALERVRARAMSMQKPDDLLEVCRIISEQLETLNVKNIRNVQVAVIDESRKNYANYQYFTAYSKPVFEETDYEYNPASQALVTEMQKSANSFFIGSIKDKELEEFRDWRKKYNQFPDPLLEDHAAIYHYFYSIGQGGLGLTTYEEISNESLEIFKRFHKVFTLAYRRFMDIQQAAGQAREAEIQLALERVRARTMAMQTSDELPETASLMAAQLKGLGEEIDQITIGIFKEEANLVEAFGTIKGDQFQTFDVSVDESFVMGNAYKAWKADKKSMTIELSGEELISYNKWRNTFFKKNIYPTDNPDGTWFVNAAFFSKGLLSFSSEKQVSQEANELLERFAAVFNLTYTRFLDLKNAEAQAREAKIETALERVRSRTMGMQSSDELQEVANILFLEVQLLGIPSWSCGYNILSPDKKVATNFMSNEGTIQKPFNLPLTEEASFIEFYRFLQSEESFFTQELGGNALESHYNFMKSLPELAPVFNGLNKAGIALPTYQINHLCRFTHGYLLFITYEPVPDAHDIFKRFAKIFDQTYTRFLDIKKAEAQARESQLELALERIRAKVTAMQESAELLDIVVTMRTEFVSLGHEAHYFWYMRWLPDKYEKAMTSGDGSRIGMVMSLPRHIHGEVKLVADWEKSDEPTIVFAMDTETAVDYVHKMITLGDFKQVDPQAPTLDDIRDLGGLTFIMARTQYGEIGFSLPGYVSDPSPESLETLDRFASVFDLAYRRFEDLKSAERQNRETQIELSLERVRSQAMAMQHSDDLTTSTAILFEELEKLELSIDRSGIGIFEEKTRDCHLWTTVVNELGEKQLTKGITSLTIHPVLIKTFDAWKASESLQYTLEGKELEDYYKLVSKSQFQLPKEIVDHSTSLTKEYYLYTPFGAGGLYVFSATEPTPEERDILRRFADVFHLTYTRFEDLQKAEMRTLEAIKQSSLDRIRGQIASMRNSDDLQQITPLIWNELTALEVPFFRCGVFIVDEEKHHVRVYLTTPEGNSLASLDLDFEMSDLTRSTVDSWRKNEVYHDHWTREAFMAWTEEMMKIRQVKNPEKYQGAETPPESLHLHFIPFAQGMLYVGNNDQLNDEQIDLVKSLAEAFSFAYARYEDFVVLEEAKKSVEKALNDLKATQTQLVHAEKMASLGELTAGIAHEIQNPLNFVNNFAEVSSDIIDELYEVINNNDTDEAKSIAGDLKQNLEKITHHGQRASSIVKGMLEHSRSGTGQKVPTDINALCDEYLRLAYHGLRAKDKSFNADFKTDFDDSLPKIELIPQDIGRVLLNLINNAFFAVSNLTGFQNLSGLKDQETYKPTVTITTKNLGDRIEISVKDNGPGIPEEIKDKIFQPFFTTKPTGQGTGLGLSMSYDIITKGHGGDIKVSSTVGEGTEFNILLNII